LSELSFGKYQASGNDFILIEDLEGALHLSGDDVQALCDRWFGVGADGVIAVRRDDDVPLAMNLVNADGTPAELSGNGMRCLAAFALDRGLVDDDVFEVRTFAGVREVRAERDHGRVTGATVGMGAANFTKAAIPMIGAAWETFLDQPFDLGGGLSVRASAVSMGNPHLVLFVPEDLDLYHVEHLGPALEHHSWFPERTNVEFVRVHDGDDEIHARVWERGVGETLACGTGACAIGAAALEAGLAPSSVTVWFPGGPLTVRREDDGQMTLGGPVGHVFNGSVDLEALA
jgi:diaminopimelate epimerase